MSAIDQGLERNIPRYAISSEGVRPGICSETRRRLFRSMSLRLASTMKWIEDEQYPNRCKPEKTQIRLQPRASARDVNLHEQTINVSRGDEMSTSGQKNGGHPALELRADTRRNAVVWLIPAWPMRNDGDEDGQPYPCLAKAMRH